MMSYDQVSKISALFSLATMFQWTDGNDRQWDVYTNSRLPFVEMIGKGAYRYVGRDWVLFRRGVVEPTRLRLWGRRESFEHDIVEALLRI